MQPMQPGDPMQQQQQQQQQRGGGINPDVVPNPIAVLSAEQERYSIEADISFFFGSHAVLRQLSQPGVCHE
jgi:hypothetical protein